jgi:hypothetical protein
MAGRFALVIGNSKYEGHPHLRNATNDAACIAEALKEIGFDVVLKKDLGRTPMRHEIRAFMAKIYGADAAVFFYAGHGAQALGKNYIFHRETEFYGDAVELKADAIDLADEVLSDMRYNARQSLVIIDACRKAVSRDFHSGDLIPVNARGFAPISLDKRAKHGMWVAFSTKAGALAADGDGSNSPFTKSLLAHIKTENITIPELMNRVIADLIDATAGNQEPWSEFGGLFDLVLCQKKSYETASQMPPAEILAQQRLREIGRDDAWREIDGRGQIEALEQLISIYDASAIDEAGRELLEQARRQLFDARLTKRWEEARASSSIEVIEIFLADYKESRYSKAALAILSYLRWPLIAETRDRTALSLFMQRFAGFHEEALAQQRLLEIERDEAWRAIKAGGKIEALEQFLSDYDASAIDEAGRGLLEQARRKLFDARLIKRWAEVRASRSIEVIEIFLKEHGDSRFSNEALAFLSVLRWPLIAETRDKAALAGFIDRFRNFPEEARARQRWLEIERDEAWLAINGRWNVKELEKFIDTYEASAIDENGRALLHKARWQLLEAPVVTRWQEVENSGSIDALERFLIDHRDSRFSKAALAKLSPLLWSLVAETRDKAAISAFIQRFRGLPEEAPARQRLLEIEREEAWRAINGHGRIEALERFIAIYAVGTIDEAGSRLLEEAWRQLVDARLTKRWAEVGNSGSIDQVEAFLAEYGNCRFSKAALAYLSALRWPQIAETRDKAALSAFIQRFSGFPEVPWALRKLQSIERDEDWSVVNGRGQIEALERFIATHTADATDQHGSKILKEAGRQLDDACLRAAPYRFLRFKSRDGVRLIAKLRFDAASELFKFIEVKYAHANQSIGKGDVYFCRGDVLQSIRTTRISSLDLFDKNIGQNTGVAISSQFDFRNLLDLIRIERPVPGKPPAILDFPFTCFPI